jgi:hypothetical protein
MRRAPRRGAVRACFLDAGGALLMQGVSSETTTKRRGPRPKCTQACSSISRSL